MCKDRYNNNIYHIILIKYTAPAEIFILKIIYYMLYIVFTYIV